MDDVWAVLEQDTTGKPIHIETDPDGTPVFLSRAVWEDHILKHHPEMVSFKDLILVAIAAPVEREYEDEDKQFVRAYADVPLERQFSLSKLRVRVMVKYVKPVEREGERTGLVSSVYLVRWKAK